LKRLGKVDLDNYNTAEMHPERTDTKEDQVDKI